MQKKSRLFIANVVLGIVFGVLLCISIIVMVVFHVAFEAVADSWDELYDGIESGSDSWNYGDEWESDDSDSWDGDSVYYTLPSITGASAELLGPVYQDSQAMEGYQYYAVTVQVQNAGTDYLISDYMDIQVAAEEYEDIYFYYEPYTETNNEFAYSNLELIPSCQTGTVSFVIEVKDTVEDVTIGIFRDYEEEVWATYVLNLK